MTSQAETAEERPFRAISFLSLLKVGITSNYVKSLGLILAFFATVYENGKSFMTHSDFDEKKMDAYLDKSIAIQSVAIIVFLLIAAILIINLVRVIFKYFDYKIARQNGSLLLSFGLLNTKSTIIKPEKGIMLKPNFRKLVFSIFLSIILPLAGFFAFGKYVQPRFLDFVYLVPLYVFFVGSIVYFGFKNNRLFVNDNFIIKQS